MITGKQISEARKRKGLTQAALSDLIDVSPEAVSKWERDAYSPSPEKEERLYHVLGIPFLEDDGTLNNGRLFDEDHMSAFLKGKMSNGPFPEALKALTYAKEKHEGQLRKPISLQIPYINHPLTMACHALAMGLEDDVLLAALLLHDVSEDCGVPAESLPFSREVQEIVKLVTKPKHGFSESAYYAAIAKNPKACMVKCIDRCNNVSGMAIGFAVERMQDYIEETEKYYPALLKVIKGIPEYNNAAWLLSYQIRSLLLTAKRIPR